jgi:Protein of unknown function (DUF1592)/Protein of unknown function (DUF1588)/Protein of unknown function (DUF1595)
MGVKTRQLGLLVGVCLAGLACSGRVDTGAPTSGSGGGTAPGSGGANPGLGGAGAPGTGGGVGTTACTPLAPITRRLWRLSSTQYVNATKDLLALSAAPTLVSTSTDGSSPYAFINGSDLVVRDTYLTTGLYGTAENIISQIAPRISGTTCTGGCILTCAAGETQLACATRFAQTFGPKVFRRPLVASEVTNLMTVYTKVCATTATGCASTPDFNTAIGTMIEALILSPSFVYRSELGPTTLTADATGKFPDTTLTPYEVATQLGFIFLNSTPDDMLTAAAANGSLATTAGIMSQVTRLMALPSVKASLTTVMTNWFNLGQLIDKANKDTSLLAALPTASQDEPGIVGELLTSGQQFINDVLWTSSGKVTDLLTSQRVFVTQRLATLYGVTAAGATATNFVGTTWPAAQATARSGILTQPAFLWAISDSALNSIVKRGKFIHDNIVCGDPLPPPIDLTTPAAQAVIMMGNSESTQSDARLNSAPAPCYGCHNQMDPYSRALQNFGPIGNYRTVDEVGVAVNPTITFNTGPLAGMTVSGAQGEAQALISTKAMAACAVQQMASYAIGNQIVINNTCELQPLRTQFDQSNGTITSLFSEVALANFVRARAGGTTQ